MTDTRPFLVCAKCSGRFLRPAKRIEPDNTLTDDWSQVRCEVCGFEYGTSLERLIEHSRAVLVTR